MLTPELREVIGSNFSRPYRDEDREAGRPASASGVLYEMRQTGSVLGVALFGSFIAGSSTVVPRLKLTLGLSAVPFATASAAAFVGLRSNR